MKNNILITGNRGYVGVVLSEYLNGKYKNKVKLTGIDNYYFKNKLTKSYNYINQFNGDIRDLNLNHLKDIDTIVHLCAISNDPMGQKFGSITKTINLDCSKQLVKLAEKSSVKKIVFASSCSIYGQTDSNLRKETDKLAPLTEYSKSKVNFEKFLSKNKSKIKKISLRFATACGPSNALRLDLVLNDFVFTALTQNKIILKSKGQSWRPLIDVRDMARAIDWAIFYNSKKNYDVFNIGSPKNTYKIIDLAKSVSKELGIKYEVAEGAVIDRRSYKVSFNKFYKVAKKMTPIYEVKRSLLDMKKYIKKNLKYIKQNHNNFIRLKSLENLVRKGTISKKLRVR